MSKCNALPVGSVRRAGKASGRTGKASDRAHDTMNKVCGWGSLHQTKKQTETGCLKLKNKYYTEI